MAYVNKGTYSALATYAKNDVVTGSDNIVYVCIEATSAGTPFTNTDYFSKVLGGLEDVIPLLNAVNTAIATANEAIDALEERVAALEPAEEETPAAEDPTEDPTNTET